MAAASTLLCIHRDPVQLNLLKENGYGVISATNGCDGLRLLMAHSVDAIVLEYHLGLLDGGVVAHEIKQVRPQLPVVMLAECLDFPDGALKSVDAFVAKSDGPHFLLATIHSVLQTKRAPQHNGTCPEQSNPATGGTISKPSKRQVLVVDDDQSVRETIATLLISAGYDVTRAEDGFGALLQLRKALPDVVVSDLDMPKMSGYELLSVIRRRFPDILTVAMSGAYQGCDVPCGVVADSFFAKGERPKILLRSLEDLLHSALARSSDHHREFAPAWVPRNGNDSHGMPSVMLTCAECLRAFQVTVVEETTGQVLEIPCCFCLGISRYIIQPATHGMRTLIA
jgi:CheY-like chemotaxis protein